MHRLYRKEMCGLCKRNEIPRNPNRVEHLGRQIGICESCRPYKVGGAFR